MSRPPESSDDNLSREIRDEIRRRGPISFRRFMELALYHPDWGYYRRPRDPFGAGGDYFTNSQLQPVFGRLVGQQIARWYEQAGRPAGFAVIELGAGRGETTAEAREFLPGVRWLTLEAGSGEWPQPFRGVVFSNEFFDALPVHVVEKRGEKLVERFVDSEPGGFVWLCAELSDPRLADYAARYVPGLADGQKIEVNLAALEQLEAIARSLVSGYVLTIDYGYTANEISTGRRFACGSLMSYARHQASDDVLREPGHRDITAHVNFTALQRRGQELGLEPDILVSQAEFLAAIGERDNFEIALKAENETARSRLRMQLKTLLFGMGETFRVLVQRAGRSRK